MLPQEGGRQTEGGRGATQFGRETERFDLANGWVVHFEKHFLMENLRILKDFIDVKNRAIRHAGFVQDFFPFFRVLVYQLLLKEFAQLGTVGNAVGNGFEAFLVDQMLQP